MGKDDPTQPQEFPREESPVLAYGLHLLHAAAPASRPFPLALDDGVEIGRNAGTSFDDPKLSRRHFAIARVPGHFTFSLKDLSSRNGTFVNGKITRRSVLRDGDVIRAGDCVFIYAPLAPTASKHAHGLVGISASIVLLSAKIEALAPGAATVLIIGESGTGKELVARALHERSRSTGPFVPVNVTAIPATTFESELFGHVRGAFTGADRDKPGLFQAAEGGTIFLDEIGDLDPKLQPKLLRTLEEGSVKPVGATVARSSNVRVLAATNHDIKRAVRVGEFRLDLFHRLNQETISVPPLRARREDLNELIAHFSAGCCEGGLHFSADALEALALHDWPGNVRELQNTVLQLAQHRSARSGVVQIGELPLEIRQRASKHQPPSEDVLPPVKPASYPEADELRRLLRAHGGQIAKVASALGKDRALVYRWLRFHAIDPDEYRNAD